MTFDGGTWWLVLTMLGLVTGSLTYLIKFALFSRLEKMEQKFDKFEKSLVNKNDYDKDIEEIKNNIETIKANYTPQRVHEKDFDECRCEIRKITENFSTKEDFIREIMKLEKKMDKMMDMLLKYVEK